MDTIRGKNIHTQDNGGWMFVVGFLMRNDEKIFE
jgi:hypothetical protein